MFSNVRYSYLFSPGRIGKMEIPNRIVMAPMATNFASETGGTNEILIDYYAKRAKGGTGLIIVENSCVDYPTGKAGALHLRLDEERFVPGMSNLVEAVHFYGTKIAAQLSHAGPSATGASTKGKGPVGASNISFALNKSPLIRTLERDEIKVIIKKYAEAAFRAKEANFDAVELHGAHAYLIAHFMSPFTNNRKDEYGGDIRGRLLFVVKIIRRIRKLLGNYYPIIFRMSGDEFIKGGRGVEESKQVASILEAEGIDAFHISAGTQPGNYPSGACAVEPMPYEQGWRVYLAEEIKKVVNVPVIAVGVIRDPDFAEEVLTKERADFVALGRGLIADPDWANKAKSGRTKSIRRCISCNEGCIKRRGFMNLPIRCSVNPEVGIFSFLGKHAVKDGRKRVLVVGGGPGGMEAARILKMRGHDVMLWEKKSVLGGQLVFASIPSFKRKLRWFLEYLRLQMDELSIPYRLEMEASAEKILEFYPDALILATGVVPDLRSINCSSEIAIKSIEDVMVENYSSTGSKIIVMGGGAKGAEVALFLSEKGEEITLVEMLDDIAGDIELISRQDLVSRLMEHGVKILTKSKITSCQNHGIEVVSRGNKKTFIPAEKFVIAIGERPNNQLKEELVGKIPQINCIGDCHKPGKIINAISQAFRVACQI